MVEADFNNNGTVSPFQDRISDLCQRRLPAALDVVIDEVLGHSVKLKIDRLVIETGSIEFKNLDKEFIPSVVEGFRRELIALRREMLHLSDSGDENYILDWLEVFLVTGSLPWWVKAEESDFVEKSFYFLLKGRSPGLISLVKRVGKKAAVRRRISLQFKEPVVLSLIKGLEPVYAGLIIEYVRNTQEAVNDDSRVKGRARELKQARWYFVLTYLLDEKSSFFETKAFLKSILTQYAGHLNLSYRTLLGTFNPPLLKAHGKTLEFLRIIRQLQDEMVKSDRYSGPGEWTERSNQETKKEKEINAAAWKPDGEKRVPASLISSLIRGDQLRLQTSLEKNNSDLKTEIYYWRGDKFPDGIQAYSRRSVLRQPGNLPDEDTLYSRWPMGQPAGKIHRDLLTYFFKNHSVRTDEHILQFFSDERRFHGFVKRFISEFPGEFSSLVKEALNSYARIGFFVERMSEELIRETVELVYPDQASLLISINKTLYDNRGPVSTGENRRSVFHKLKWQIALNFLFVDRGSLFNTKAYINYTLNQLVNRYNLEHKAVLDLIRGILKEMERSGSRDATLAVILREIVEEEAVILKDHTGHPNAEHKRRSGLSREAWLNTFVSFLDTGRLPWWSEFRSTREILHKTEILSRVSTQEAEYIVNAILQKKNISALSSLVNKSSFRDIVTVLEKVRSPLTMDFRYYSGLTFNLGTETERKAFQLMVIYFGGGIMASTLTADLFLGSVLKNIARSLNLSSREIFSVVKKFVSSAPFKTDLFVSASRMLLVNHGYAVPGILGSDVSKINKRENNIIGSDGEQEAKNEADSYCFFYFLQNGLWPAEVSQTFSLDELLNRLIKTNNDLFVSDLRRLMKNEKIVHRLILHLSEDTWRAVLIRLTGKKSIVQSDEVLKTCFGYFLTGKEFTSNYAAAWHIILSDWDVAKKYSLGRVFRIALQRLGMINEKKSPLLLSELKQKMQAASAGNFMLLRELIDMEEFVAKRKTLQRGKKNAASKLPEEEMANSVSRHSANEAEEVFYVNNSGLVILSPFLVPYFTNCGLLESNQFVDKNAAHRAVHLLQYLVTGKENFPEHFLALNKLLCGIKTALPVERTVELTVKEKELSDSLLETVITYWTALKKTSVDGLRGSFFIRKGKIENMDEHYRLTVEKQPYDILMDKLPWGINPVKLPWMDKPLYVNWKWTN